MEVNQSNGPPDPALRRSPRLPRLLAVAAVVVVVIVAGYATYGFVQEQATAGEPTLVVYAYSSLLGGCSSALTQTLFAAFGNAHGVHVELDCPSGTLVSTLLAERNAPVADVVIGLDEITGPEAEANGLLVPYASPALTHVNATLAAELSPDAALTPYEWGYLAFDYKPSFDAETGGAVGTANFSAFAANTTWASNLIVEDPTVDITGEEFLLWEIAYYTTVLHGDWTSFWRAIDPYVTVAPDWSTAFGDYAASAGSPGVVVSYSTDPAYAAGTGAPGTINATVSWNGSTGYGWRTVYGLGIVNGSRQTALDRAFVDWFLSSQVQYQIPANEWEYPANDTTPLPTSFQYAVNPLTIVPLNDAVGPSTIVASLPGWLETWQTIANAPGG